MVAFYKILITMSVILAFEKNIYANEKNKSTKTELSQGLTSAPGKVVNLFHNALQESNKDVITKLLDTNVLIFEGGGVERSAKEYISHHLISDMAFMSKMKVEKLEHQVVIYGEIAISSSRSRIKGIYKEKTIDRITMESIVLRKIGGKWKIINIHWS